MEMSVPSGPHKPTVDDSVAHRANRAQARHGMLVDCFRHVIADMSVLCLGAGDGAWCGELAKAGALQVVGVEAQASLIDKFHRVPMLGARERIEMRQADPVQFLQEQATAGARFDVVMMLDVLRDTAAIHQVFADLADLGPIMVLGDDLMARTDEPVLRLEARRGPMDSRAAPHLIPSRGAITQSAKAAGFDVDWTDWTQVPEDMRSGLSDYYRTGPVGRASFTLVAKDK